MELKHALYTSGDKPGETYLNVVANRHPLCMRQCPTVSLTGGPVMRQLILLRFVLALYLSNCVAARLWYTSWNVLVHTLTDIDPAHSFNANKVNMKAGGDAHDEDEDEEEWPRKYRFWFL